MPNPNPSGNTDPNYGDGNPSDHDWDPFAGMTMPDFSSFGRKRQPTGKADPISTIDLKGEPKTVISGCRVADFERLAAVGGRDALHLVAAKRSPHKPEKTNLEKLPVALEQSGPLDSVAWGHDPVAGELILAAFGNELNVHRIAMGGGGEARMDVYDFATVGIRGHKGIMGGYHMGQVRAGTFIEGHPERVALTGDGQRCYILDLTRQPKNIARNDDNEKYSPESVPGSMIRNVMLQSSGCMVQTHPREPHQLMIAQDAGIIDFIDLRVPDGRPSLRRITPPFDDPGGLCAADWSLHSPYLIGGAVGSQWMCWDIRQTEYYPPPSSTLRVTGCTGDAKQGLGLCQFRFSPHSPTFVTAGTSNELLVHSLSNADGPSGLAPSGSPPYRCGNELTTRVADVSWLHVQQPPLMVGVSDTKVCLWDVPEGAKGPPPAPPPPGWS